MRRKPPSSSAKVAACTLHAVHQPARSVVALPPLVGSHQCVKYALFAPCASHHAASWSSTSLNTRSHVLPYGFDALPAELRKADVASATSTEFSDVLLSLPTS